jgi:hypothetical protein
LRPGVKKNNAKTAKLAKQMHVFLSKYLFFSFFANHFRIRSIICGKCVIARRFLPKQSPGIINEIASSQRALLAMTGRITIIY